MRQLVKHVPVRQVCRSLGIPIFDLYYVAYRWDAVRSGALNPFLELIDQARVKVNFGHNSQPSVLARDLPDILYRRRHENVVGEAISCARVGTVIPADLAGGSAKIGDGRIIVEAFSAETRSSEYRTTDVARYLLDADGAVTEARHYHSVSLSDPELRRIAEITTLLTERIGQIRLEWYVAGGKVYVKDLSIERDPLTTVDAAILSPGLLEGRALILKDISALRDSSLDEQISVVEHTDHQRLIETVPSLRRLRDQISASPGRAVIVAPYPSLALIAIASGVAGFIFERGNLLCHTAIVLREQMIPAYVVPDAFTAIAPGCQVRVGPGGLRTDTVPTT
jgi:hypothetical protein